MQYGIKWRGTDTRRVCKWEVKADNCCQLYNELINKGIISTYDYDPDVKYIFDYGRCEKSYDEVKDEIFDLMDEGVDYEVAVKEVADKYGVSTDLTDEDYMNIILGEDGNAYYQEFTYDDDGICACSDESDLEFDEDGELIWEHKIKLDTFPGMVKVHVGDHAVEIKTDGLEYEESDVNDFVHSDIDTIRDEIGSYGVHLFDSDRETIYEELVCYYLNECKGLKED